MQKFDEYITEKRIIFYLCRIRAKYAKQRSKKHLIHLLSESDEFNYHSNKKKKKEKKDKDLELLNGMLPSRRNWKKLNKGNRYPEDNQRINSVDYNVKSLLITIDYYKKHFPEEPFLKNLDSFIKDLQASVNDPDYKIEAPTIIPKLKGVKNQTENKCRPISHFNLKDRLIISFTNKYFTEVFDKYFYSHSYAFRAVQTNGVEKKVFTHHDSIQTILDYKKSYKGQRLWVTECDISKFYDSVHHKIVITQFKKIIKRVKNDTPDDYDLRAERIFYKYLDSYSFVKNALPLNEKKNENYWIEEHEIPGGYFGWVESDLIRLKYFKKIKNAKIGVPQGGAISGLIANLVLDYADQKIIRLGLTKLMYVRFCDDMVIIHPSKKECMKASGVYSKSLRKLNLIPHEFKAKLTNTSDSFWSDDIKSKHPYKWSLNCKDSFPWFGFVGYEINYSGDLRVRKSSLNKEKQKQNKVVTQVLKAVKIGKRKSDGTICESAVNRLIGMSVGRVNIKNYSSIDSDMCWVNGFIKLKENRHLKAQLKDLDRNRAKQMSFLLKSVKEIKTDESKLLRIKIGKLAFCVINNVFEKDSEMIRSFLVLSRILNKKFQLIPQINLDDSSLDLGLTEKYEPLRADIIDVLKHPVEKSRVVYYGKPFSYYYHIIEKKKEK